MYMNDKRMSACLLCSLHVLATCNDKMHIAMHEGDFVVPYARWRSRLVGKTRSYIYLAQFSNQLLDEPNWDANLRLHDED